MNPLVESSDALADTRAELHTLREQVALYTQFKELLDKARYHALFEPKIGAAKAQAASEALLKAHRARVLTADDPAAVRRHLADAYADFGSLAAAKAASAWPQKPQHTSSGGERKAA